MAARRLGFPGAALALALGLARGAGAAPLRVAPADREASVPARRPKAPPGKVLGAKAIRFRVSLAGPRHLDVQADFPTLAEPAPTLGFYGGYFRWIEDLRVTGLGGGRIPAHLDKESETWTVAAKGRPFTVRYRVVSRKAGMTGRKGEDRVFEPAIFPDWVLLWGDSYLIRPEGETGYPGGYRIFVDHGPYKAFNATFQAGELLHSDYELDESLLIAGDFRHYRSTAGGLPVHFAIRGKRWGFDDDAWVEKVRAMVACQVGFMGGSPVPRILAVLCDGGGSAYCGLCTRDSFVIFPEPPARFEDTDTDILGTAAHEMFHFWCGGLTTNWRLANGHTNWFVEGFCDYYAALTLLRLGWITPLQFVDRLNGMIRTYMENPTSLAADRKLLEAFIDQDGDLSDLPYWKGALIAWMLDLDIRARTKGRRTLDDYVRLVVSRAPEHDNLKLRLLLTRLAGASWRGFFDRYVEGSEPLPFEETGARHGLTFEVAHDEPALDVVELGFSVESAPLPGPGKFVVSRLHPGSEAAKAGLREGDEIEDADLVLDPRREGRLTVRRGGARLVIAFRPLRSIQVPRLRRDGAALRMARQLAKMPRKPARLAREP